MMGTCEDCIFGKMHARAYDEEVVHEAEILERVHIDLWGPSPVMLAGGARYFMLIMDGASAFWYVEFLKEKTADATLNVLKKFLAEAERLTVMNRLDPIEELYDMYSEEEDTPRIVEVVNDGLDFDLDIEGPANPYMDL